MKEVLALPLGMILLAIAILMEKFLPSNHLFDFMEGLFTGLSLVLNFYYIFAIARNKNGKVKK